MPLDPTRAGRAWPIGPASAVDPVLPGPPLRPNLNATDVDATGGPAAPRGPSAPLGPRQQAVATLRAWVNGGKLAELLAAEPQTGELKSVEARKVFAALPTLNASTTAKELLDLGLIPKIPEGIDEMWSSSPRYFVGRQVLASAPVVTSLDDAQKFHTYQAGGEVRVTHRAYLLGEQGGDFKVLVEGNPEAILVPKAEIYRLNEGQRFTGNTGRAYGATVDYDKDPILKAKICAALIKLEPVLQQLDYRIKDPAQLDRALADHPRPPVGTPAMRGTGVMVEIDSWSQDGVGKLSEQVAEPVRELLKALGQEVTGEGHGLPATIGPMVQRILNSLVKDGQAVDLGTLDWPRFAADLQGAVRKDYVLSIQRKVLHTVHAEIDMKHPRDFGAHEFGTQYRGQEAGKLANGGLGVCNTQASVLFAMLQPLKHLLGYETQLEMGACIRPRPDRQGNIMQAPPHGWVMVSMWPSGERFVSDRTWHHPCLALDHAFSLNGDRRHLGWDPKVVQTTTVTSKQLDFSGVYLGAKPQPVTSVETHGRPDH